MMYSSFYQHKNSCSISCQLTYTISQYTTVTFGVILSAGDSTLPLSANVAIFEAVQ